MRAQNILLDAEAELAGPRFSQVRNSSAAPNGEAKMSRASAWSTPSQRSPGGHDTIKSERHNLSFVSVDHDLPLSTDP